MVPPALSPATAMSAGDSTHRCRRPGCPLEHGVGVIDRRGERVLGRQPVVDRDHDSARRAGEVPADVLVGLDASLHEPAAVEVQQDRPGPRALRSVDPDRDRVIAGRDRRVTDVLHPRELPVKGYRRAREALPHPGRGKGEVDPCGPRQPKHNGDQRVQFPLRRPAQELHDKRESCCQQRNCRAHDHGNPHSVPPRGALPAQAQYAFRMYECKRGIHAKNIAAVPRVPDGAAQAAGAHRRPVDPAPTCPARAPLPRPSPEGASPPRPGRVS